MTSDRKAIWVTPETHQRVRRYALEHGVTAQEVAEEALLAWLGESYQRCTSESQGLRCGLQDGHIGPHWCSGYAWGDDD